MALIGRIRRGWDMEHDVTINIHVARYSLGWITLKQGDKILEFRNHDELNAYLDIIDPIPEEYKQHCEEFNNSVLNWAMVIIFSLWLMSN